MCSEVTGGILDFCSIYDFYVVILRNIMPDFLFGVGFDGRGWLAYTLSGFTLGLLVLNFALVSTALYTWLERRLIGRFQARLGPNRWGPFGLFQPIADGLKFLTKEDTVPAVADRLVFTLAPIMLVAPALLIFTLIPFGQNSFLGRLNVGVLFVIGITGLNTIAIFMGGWGSRNKYAILVQCAQ